ncbi:response regulator [Rubrivirga sp. S365]|uniref:Response regulator n=1 Tax=Rubrivirga litoralis TaxID=3075598 RepID=A0ABU3BR27_9BACT|nr:MULTISPECIES: response regulator [unclassified Rubrivirga]MDT0631737.1 response regulator [Rubrivirga sp. F394]MDT7856099.1 response regulator [Rubrivirga sp. S365]
MESIPAPRVLLVDGDAADRRAALDLLRRLGVTADEAADGEAGVRRCLGTAYDAVLLALRLPAMDGVAALRAVRTSLPAERRPCLVAVADHAEGGAREAALAAGFDAFCAKPFGAEALVEALGLAAPPAARPAPPHEATVAETVQTLYDQVCAHVTDMLGEEDPEFVADLVESFAASAREAVAEAESTRSAGDVAGLAAAAHQLKGSASNVGLNTIAGRWGEVEAMARGGAASDEAVDRALDETTQAVDLLADRV